MQARALGRKRSVNEPADPREVVQSGDASPERIITDELEELVLQMDYPKEQLDPLKDILNRVLNSLRVIQEITRHIDERINQIEHKITKGVGPR